MQKIHQKLISLITTLGLEVNVNPDGTVNIFPIGGNPGDDVASLDDKFDKGDDSELTRDRIYTNAALMEKAIKANSGEIDKLQETLGGIIDPDGEINVTLDGFFQKYEDDDDDTEALVYDSASKMGMAVLKNVDDIAKETKDRKEAVKTEEDARIQAVGALREDVDANTEIVESLAAKEYLTTDIKLANPTAEIRAAGYQTQSDFNNAFAPFFTSGALKWNHLSEGLA